MPDFGDGSPREDYGSLDPNAPSVANGQITPAQWADYQAKRRRDAILGMLGVLGGATGLGALGGALGGAGAASPAFGIGAANTGTWGGIGMTPAAFTGAGGAGAAAAGVGAGMSMRDWIALATGAAGTIGGALSKPPDLNPNTGTNDPQLKELLALMMGRIKKTEPLNDSILSMANGLLPTKYQNGGRG